jgi:phage terminase large subunit
LGAGVADRLKELNVPAIPVQVSELAAHGDLYHRLRDELWFMSRDYFSEKNCCFTDELDLDLREALISELATVTYKYTSTGKLLVESKEDLKARLGKDGMSPNLADAFNLSLCKLNRYRERKRAVPVQVASSKGWT